MERDPLAQYRRVSLETQVDQATPHRLIQLLFEGLTERLQRLLLVLRAPDADTNPERSALFARLLDILSTLRSSLQSSTQAIDPIEKLPLSSSLPSVSGVFSDELPRDLPRNLDALYEYCQRRLLQANIESDADAVAEVFNLINTLKLAWDDISPTVAVTVLS